MSSEASDEPELPEVLTDPLPAGWRPLAGGFVSGDVLLVLTGDGLHRVKARELGYGFAIEKTPLSVLRSLLSAHGLHIVDAKDWAVLRAWETLSEDARGAALEAQEEIEYQRKAELARREKT